MPDINKVQPTVLPSLFSESRVLSREQTALALKRFRKNGKISCQGTPTKRIYRAAVGHAVDWMTVMVPRTPRTEGGMTHVR